MLFKFILHYVEWARALQWDQFLDKNPVKKETFAY